MNEPTRQERIDGMRKVCNFLESHPEFQLPYEFQSRTSAYINGKEELVAHVKMMGSGRKEVDNDFFRFVKDFGGAELEVLDSRSAICERIVVEIREVESEEADPVAVAAIPIVKVKKTVEIVEWRCPESLLGTDASGRVSG